MPVLPTMQEQLHGLWTVEHLARVVEFFPGRYGRCRGSDVGEEFGIIRRLLLANLVYRVALRDPLAAGQ